MRLKKYFLPLGLIHGVIFGSLSMMGVFLSAKSITYLHLDNSNANLTLILSSADQLEGWHLPNRIYLGSRNYYMYDSHSVVETRDGWFGVTETLTVEHSTNESIRALPKDTLHPWANLTEIYRDALNHHRAEGLPELQIGEVHLPRFPKERRGPQTLLGCALWKEQILAPMTLLFGVFVILCYAWCLNQKSADGSTPVLSSKMSRMFAVYILYHHAASLIYHLVFSCFEPYRFMRLVMNTVEGSSEYGIQVAGPRSSIMNEVIYLFIGMQIPSFAIFLVLAVLCFS